MKKRLLFIWQLPQNIIGYFLSKKAFKKEISIDEETIDYYISPYFFNSGISLGKYIILDGMYLKYEGTTKYENIIRHEHGHQIQSKKLGLFYLLIIGLPSLCGNIFNRVAHKKWTSKKRNKWYYSQPWEHWADKLGGVNR